MTKIIIAGCRHFDTDAHGKWVRDRMDGLIDYNKDIIIVGGARGIDTFGWQIALQNNCEAEQYFPDYCKHPVKYAPLARNKKMAEVGDVLYAFWDGKSRGTAHMIRSMQELGKQTTVYIWNGD